MASNKRYSKTQEGKDLPTTHHFYKCRPNFDFKIVIESNEVFVVHKGKQAISFNRTHFGFYDSKNRRYDEKGRKRHWIVVREDEINLQLRYSRKLWDLMNHLLL
ncbi:MAG: hypothetical protein FWC68_01320 [Oscillospiraceae bacterium]|nr:hypothetical protein [Oscillospiraceae bacterium]